MTSLDGMSTLPFPASPSPNSTTTSTAIQGLASASATQQPPDDNRYHALLLSINTVVLLSGTLCVGLVVHILQSNMRSVTTIAVLNLIFGHFVFLLTVPFRIYYYATHHWGLGHGWCKTVSSMIHVHMYMSFVFYVIILVMRLLIFYHRAEQLQFQRKLHALIASVMLWTVVFVVVPCIVHFCYGNKDGNVESKDKNSTTCFQYATHINKAYFTRVFNYTSSGIIIVVASVLLGLQANVLVVLYKRYGRGCTSQQVFWAQLKSLCFALIMVVCCIPYHMFRLYYIDHLYLEDVNEVFLSLTTLSCYDMVTFVGRGSCCRWNRGRAV
ncbi:putative G-protein coupled receptor 141 isoform 1-T2 [Polymixia lowei]